jgi:tetrahydromethanopterin S-methyltransferase subunit A
MNPHSRSFFRHAIRNCKSVTNKETAVLKVSPHPDYPPEEGRYLRGNDYSPVAVAIILNTSPEKTPSELEMLVRAGLESGAALSGTVQTENIGFEKIVCNVVANPNIRYLVVGGPESEGHLTGEALKALIQQGVDEKRRIIGTLAPHPFLFNLPMEMIERFRRQLLLVDLQFEGDPGLIRKAIWSCCQESSVPFRGYSLYDMGAYPAPALSGKITWRVNEPWAEVLDDEERAAKKRARDLMDRLRRRSRGESV